MRGIVLLILAFGAVLLASVAHAGPRATLVPGKPGHLQSPYCVSSDDAKTVVAAWVSDGAEAAMELIRGFAREMTGPLPRCGIGNGPAMPVDLVGQSTLPDGTVISMVRVLVPLPTGTEQIVVFGAIDFGIGA